MTLVLAGKVAWVALVIAWFVLRYPFERRARRLRVRDDRLRLSERLRLAVSTLGLGIIPGAYVAAGWPPSLDRAQPAWAFALGIVAAIAALVLFRVTHKALGRMWSVTLQMKENHQLVTTGIYRHLRHPMYSAFWLMALAQAFLLPNWFAGMAGIVGFGTLFALRVGPEEKMMEDTFGQAYRDYRSRTWRVLPYIF